MNGVNSFRKQLEPIESFEPYERLSYFCAYALSRFTLSCFPTFYASVLLYFCAMALSVVLLHVHEKN